MASEWTSVEGKQSPWFLAYVPEEELERVRSLLREQRPDWPLPPPPPTKAEWRARLAGDAGTTEASDGSIVKVDLSPFADLPDDARLHLTQITTSGAVAHSQEVLDSLLERRRRPDLYRS